MANAPFSCSSSSNQVFDPSSVSWDSLTSLTVSQDPPHIVYTVHDSNQRGRYTDLMKGLVAFKNFSSGIEILSRFPFCERQQLEKIKTMFQPCVNQAFCPQFFDMAHQGLGKLTVTQSPIEDPTLSQQSRQTFALKVHYTSISDHLSLSSNESHIFSWNPNNSLLALKISQLPLQIQYTLSLNLERENAQMLQDLLKSYEVDNLSVSRPPETDSFQFSFSILITAKEVLADVKKLFQHCTLQAHCQKYFDLVNEGQGQLSISQTIVKNPNAARQDLPPRISFDVHYQLTTSDTLPTIFLSSLAKTAVCAGALPLAPNGKAEKTEDDEKENPSIPLPFILENYTTGDAAASATTPPQPLPLTLDLTDEEESLPQDILLAFGGPTSSLRQ